MSGTHDGAQVVHYPTWVGLPHIPDMLNPGMIEFNTWFYPQLAKKGTVVDVRWNGSGSYSQLMLER